MNAPDGRPVSSLAQRMDGLQVHDHLCLIHETDEEQRAAIAPFFAAGLARGQRCVYLADERSAGGALEWLTAAGVEADAAVARGALRILGARDSFLRGGSFAPERMLALLRESVAEARRDGFAALRVTGEMTWALGQDVAPALLIEYESRLNLVLADEALIVIGQYDRRRFPPEIIREIIFTHPLVITGGTVCRNFYYVPPEQYLQPVAAAAEVERLLQHVRDRAGFEDHLRSRERELSAVNAAVRAESTWRAQMARDLAVSESRLRSLLEASQDEAYLLAPDGTVLAANAIGARGFGLEAPDLVGRVVWGLFPPDLAERRRRAVERVLHSGEPELVQDTRDGRSWEGTIGPVREGGEVIGVAVFARDVTEQEHAAAALRHSQLLLEAVVEGTPDAVYVKDAEGRYLLLNQAAAHFLGLPPAQVLGRDDTAVFPPEDAAAVMAVDRAVMAAGESRTYEEQLTTAGGRRTWFLVTRGPVFDAAGAVAGLYGISRDITARKEERGEMERSDAQLGEAVDRYRDLSEVHARLLAQARQDAETKSVLLQEVNHRVKNNLAAILGILALEAESDLRTPEQFAHAMADLRHRVEALAAAHELLSASEWGPLDVADLVERAVRAVLSASPAQQWVAVSVDRPAEPPRVNAKQATALALVATEIATNGVKYAFATPRRGRLSIRISAAGAVGGAVTIVVTDDGPGWPDDILGGGREGVGLRLMRMLARSPLRGSLALANRDGAEVTLTFTPVALRGADAAEAEAGA